nr:4-hydroxythreonine-4-phosphate dehydrogenase PdxA [Spirochaetota bacterium]
MIDSYPLITLGSPYGVGYEIFLLSVADKFFTGHTPFCVGSESVMKLFIKELDVRPVYKIITKDELNDCQSISDYDFILINVDDKGYGISDIFSISKETDGEIAYKTIKESAYLVKDLKFKSVTTLPVSKDNINLFDKDFYGHTEFYQKIWEQKEVFMTFVSEKLNVLLLTTHIPLKEVAKTIDKNLLRRGIE